MTYQRKKRSQEKNQQIPVPQEQTSLFSAPDLETADAENSPSGTNSTDGPNWNVNRRQASQPSVDFGGISIFPKKGWGKREPQSPLVQAKLTVGAVSDKYEKAVDRVSSPMVKPIHDFGTNQQLVQRALGKRSGPQSSRADAVQRVEKEEDDLQMEPDIQRVGLEGGAVSAEFEADIQKEKGKGHALEPKLQGQVEQAMEIDLNDLNIHTDAKADQLNRAINAQAFTIKNDVFFRQGAYQPKTREGKELIVHEITHTEQQGGAGAKRVIDTSMKPSKEATSWEVIRKRVSQSGYDFGGIPLYESERAAPQERWGLSSRPLVQAKLTVGAMDDKYEQEADRVASQVVRTIHPPMRMKGEEINQDVRLEKGEGYRGGQDVATTKIISGPALRTSESHSTNPIQRAPYNVKGDEMLSLYNQGGERTARVMGGTELDIDKSQTVTIERNDGAELCYKVVGGYDNINHKEQGYADDDVYISIFDVQLSTTEILEDAVEADTEDEEGYKQAEGLDKEEWEEIACWNWALTAYEDDGLRPDYIFGAFEQLRRTFGDDATREESQEDAQEMLAALNSYRDETPILKDSEETKALFNTYKARIVQSYREWRATELKPFDRARALDDIDYYMNTVKPITDNNIRPDESHRVATLKLTKIAVEANGFEVTEGEDKQFYICMHEKKTNVGYEHWWIEDLQGNVMQKFPVNWINPNDHSEGKKGLAITYQNFAEGDPNEDFTYKIGIKDLKDRHKEIMLRDLNTILTRGPFIPQ